MSRPFLLAAVVAVWILPATAAPAADPNVSTVAPNENLVVDGVPPIPAEIAEKAGRYGEYRGATLLDADRNGQVLIATRFGDTNQVCLVTEPFGERTQLTFFPDRVEGALFEPTEAKYFVFHKGAGGAEFYQNYRFDLFSGDITLLTDGKSRNSLPTFSYDGKQIAYTSTRRDGTDTDLYVENPLDPRSDRLLSQCQGGGWAVQDWSVDGRQLLVTEEISINESYLWLVDAITGAKTALTPRQAGGEKVAYRKALFVRGMLPNGGQSVSPGDYKGILVLTDQGGEYIRLACLDPETGRQWPLSDDLPADVEDFALSNNGESIAYTTNDAGFSTLRLLGLKRHDFLTGTTEYGVVGNRYKPGDAKQTPTFPEVIVRSTPQPYSRGVITGLRWNTATKNGGPESFLYFNLANAGIPSDVFYHTTDSVQPTGGLYGGFARFTQSETGGLPPYSFVRPQPIHWKSFDDREVSGFLYAPDAKKFPGKRPVIVNIHGGPEAQYRPGFLGRNNYLINELGCAMIFPNVRGSSGYGKTFVGLDDGFKREDSYKDIDALLDWVKTQPDLDADRIMVTGGSYGGHMTLAVSTFYADKIRCSVDVVGMSNLRTFLEHTESYRRDLRRVEYGDERDPKMAEFLDRIAPLNNAQKITRPMFVVQGYNDPRVPRTEAEQIVATLKKQGTPVWFLMAKDEGHGFAKKKNADYQFYATVEFIRRYLLN